MGDPAYNPGNKRVVIFGPKITNRARIAEFNRLGAKVVHSLDDLDNFVR